MNITNVAKNFRYHTETVLLTGGHGTTYLCGDFVLKPVTDNEEAKELAEIILKCHSTSKLRIPKPILSQSGEWIYGGYVAWEYLDGKDAVGQYEEKIKICDWFDEIVASSQKPKFLESANHAWALADKVAWGEIEKEYSSDFEEIIKPIYSGLKGVSLPPTLIHGDLNGNVIFHKHLPPAVIDMTLYWRPKDFAKAIVVIDGIVSDGAHLEIYKLIKYLPEIKQLMLRAGLRRILEQAEHVERGVKSNDEALRYGKKFAATLADLDII